MLPADSFIGKQTGLKLIKIEIVIRLMLQKQRNKKLQCGTAEMVQVESSAKTETEQKRIEKENMDTMVVMTQAPEPTNGVNSSIAIGVSSSSLEGNISFCRGFAETVPAETFMVKVMRQMRRVDRASKEMQEDTEKGMEREQVEFIDNIVLRQLLRRPRYFDGPSHNGWEMCSNCGQDGHMVCQRTMRKWKRQKLCFLCGSLNHVGKRCRKNRFCSVCKGRGHRAKHCPGMICFHAQLTICLMISRKFSVMFAEVFGHLCCVDFPDIDPGESCGATGSAKACTINVEPKAILQEIEVIKGREQVSC
ncbi:ZINC KNUCKLE (CCHC-TYPE) FAMILY PROTEIN [Salix purpurea]|uniref:ZINC KNUCKLE (CCHC-TYPE) FAMILY PROTEIN n=1 Tax=Salix purpurea TaxID=77065 RepID=A0A9Q1A354_SALPP|nr:ZINC KNUCKLE (CCHC-TYPE) FAMILY PROTEIN [Salix purpurea]